MGSQKNVLEVILNSSRSVFNIQSLRMLTECGNSQKLTQSLYYYIKEGNIEYGVMIVVNGIVIVLLFKRTIDHDGVF